MGENSFVQLPTHRWTPASGLMRRGSHAPRPDRQVQVNSGSVPMHAHAHDTTTDPPTVRRFDDAKNSVFDPDAAPYVTLWTSWPRRERPRALRPFREPDDAPA